MVYKLYFNHLIGTYRTKKKYRIFFNSTNRYQKDYRIILKFFNYLIWPLLIAALPLIQISWHQFFKTLIGSPVSWSDQQIFNLHVCLLFEFCYQANINNKNFKVKCLTLVLYLYMLHYSVSYYSIFKVNFLNWAYI